MEEKSMSFEEFYYLGFSSEQNAGILRRLLKSEHFAHLLSEEKIKQIKTKEELEHVYNRILQRANYQRSNNLVITNEKRMKAEKSITEKTERKITKNLFKGGISTPVFYFGVGYLVVNFKL